MAAATFSMLARRSGDGNGIVRSVNSALLTRRPSTLISARVTKKPEPSCSTLALKLSLPGFALLLGPSQRHSRSLVGACGPGKRLTAARTGTLALSRLAGAPADGSFIWRTHALNPARH